MQDSQNILFINCKTCKATVIFIFIATVLGVVFFEIDKNGFKHHVVDSLLTFILYFSYLVAPFFLLFLIKIISKNKLYQRAIFSLNYVFYFIIVLLFIYRVYFVKNGHVWFAYWVACALVFAIAFSLALLIILLNKFKED